MAFSAVRSFNTETMSIENSFSPLMIRYNWYISASNTHFMACLSPKKLRSNFSTSLSSVLTPSKIKSVFSLFIIKSSCPIDFFNVMTKTQFFVCTISQTFDFVIVQNKVAIWAQKIVRHQICIM